MIGIINYGMGNLASVQNALNFLKIPNAILNTPKEMNKYDKFILPGVGAFGMAMENLTNIGFDEAIKEQILSKKKSLLGICLGMQLILTDSTEFRFNKGLDLIKGHVLSFKEVKNDLCIPHIGWNEVRINNSKLIELTAEMNKPSFYFVHSFYCKLEDEQYVTGITDYGIDFHSVFEAGNIMGCQFHPEKSQKYGLNIFSKFFAL